MKNLIFLFVFFISCNIPDIGPCGPGSVTRIGAICESGKRSYSTGSGTCSRNGGVSYWLCSGDEDINPTNDICITTSDDLEVLQQRFRPIEKVDYLVPFDLIVTVDSTFQDNRIVINGAPTNLRQNMYIDSKNNLATIELIAEMCGQNLKNVSIQLFLKTPTRVHIAKDVTFRVENAEFDIVEYYDIIAINFFKIKLN